jgi:hypothetical protein
MGIKNELILKHITSLQKIFKKYFCYYFMVEVKKKKGIKDLWEDIDVPVIILVVWSAVVLFFRVDQFISSKLIYNILSWGITLVVFGYIGYSLAGKKRGKDATRAGAYAGVIVGFVSAVLAIIAYYIFPGFFDAQIAEAVKAGADIGTVNLFMKIGLYASLIISPVISGVIGAFASWIGSKVHKVK